MINPRLPYRNFMFKEDKEGGFRLIRENGTSEDLLATVHYDEATGEVIFKTNMEYFKYSSEGLDTYVRKFCDELKMDILSKKNPSIAKLMALLVKKPFTFEEYAYNSAVKDCIKALMEE